MESAFGRTFADGAIHKQHLPLRNAGVIREVTRLTGVERMLSFRALKSYPVVVIVGSSVEEILAPWRLQAGAIGASGILAVLALIAIGAVLIRLARREETLLAEARDARNAAELATKAAERASRAKSEFLASVSHDLCTPLNSIIGFSDVMADGLGGALSARSRVYSYIGTSSARPQLAKVEANHMTVLDENFSLHGVVGECLRLVSAQAGAGRVTLVPYTERELALNADPVRVRQILFNLLSNAIKFTPPGGTVEVRSTRADEGSLRLSVVDTGIGMTPGELTAAMQPYGQVVNAFTREREGSGLGLPLVKALVELHDGRFGMTSAPKRGTTATAVFPPERVLLQKDMASAA